MNDNKPNNVAYVGATLPPQSTQTWTVGTQQPVAVNPQIYLFQKLFKAMSEIDTIKKSGLNKHQGYQYSTEADLIEATKKAIVNNRILVLTSSETKEIVKLSKTDKNGGGSKETLVTVVNTTHTFVDIDNGSTFEVKSTGTGWDETDKGVFKAITGAMKYFMSKNFLVASEDDPEADGANPSYVRNGNNGGGASATAPLPSGISSRRTSSTASTANAAPKAAPTSSTAAPAPARKSFGNRATTAPAPVVQTKPSITAPAQETKGDLVGKPSFSKRVAANEEPNFQYEQEEDI